MRIIAGQFKGRKILEPTDRTTRPLKDLVKESIFNIINHSRKLNINLKNSNVLDLFSGVGSFGLEALSREAGNVIFIENYSVSLSILKKNLEILKLEERSKIIDADIFNNFDFKTLKKKIDIIFLDPPFKEKNISYILSKIKEANILDVGSGNGDLAVWVAEQCGASQLKLYDVVSPDENTQSIASITGGEYYKADNPDELLNAFYHSSGICDPYIPINPVDTKGCASRY